MHRQRRSQRQWPFHNRGRRRRCQKLRCRCCRNRLRCDERPFLPCQAPSQRSHHRLHRAMPACWCHHRLVHRPQCQSYWCPWNIRKYSNTIRQLLCRGRNRCHRQRTMTWMCHVCKWRNWSICRIQMRIDAVIRSIRHRHNCMRRRQHIHNNRMDPRTS